LSRPDRAGAAIVSLAIVALGLYVVWEGLGMNVGTLRRIGPGFFPIMLGTAMALLGAATLLERPERDADEPFGLWPLACVAAALLAFAFLIDRAGLVAATVALVALTSAGLRHPSPRSAALAAAALCAIGYLVFILGLRLPVRALPGGW
jgi:hypothetical protein